MSTISDAPVHVEDLLKVAKEVTISGLDYEQFRQLSVALPMLRMEQNEHGKVIIMAPVKGGSGYRESKLSYYINQWYHQSGQGGMTFSASTGFHLPDGSTRSPDFAWISESRLQMLSPQVLEEQYVPTVPNFIVELRSQSDRLSDLINKVSRSWIGQGTLLAWLIDPYEEQAYIFRPEQEPEIIADFSTSLFGEDLLPGLELPLSEFRLLDRK